MTHQWMVITTSYCEARTFTYYPVAVRVYCKYANKIFNKNFRISVNAEQFFHLLEEFLKKDFAP
jgi:hypothetical protein